MRTFDDGQREVLDQIVGTIICDDSWNNFSLPIGLSRLGVRRSHEQYKGAFMGSIIASHERNNRQASLRK